MKATLTAALLAFLLGALLPPHITEARLVRGIGPDKLGFGSIE